MKKHICVLLPILITLFGCTDPVHDISKLNSTTIDPVMGRVIIGQEEPQSRTLLPQTPVFVSYLLTFQYQGEGEVSKDNQTTTSLPCTVDLFPGSWLITVTAYTRIEGVQGLADGIYPVANGSTTVTVSHGVSLPVAVNLHNGTDIAGKGIFEYNISLPPENLLATATLRVLGIDNSEAASKNLLEAASGKIILNAGYYFLQVQVTTGRMRSRTELIHIYRGHTTRASGIAWNFNAEEGVYFSVTELSEYLASVPANTIATPYAVALNVSNLGGTSDAAESVGKVLKNNSAKYINLNLSGSTFTNVGNSAFNGCTSLASITIPDSVTGIGNDAFSGCTSLPGITIPNNVISIGDSAFNGCTSLTGVTIPDSVTSISNVAFSGCTSLTSVTFQGAINSSGFDNNAFSALGDLRDKYLIEGIGTYTRNNNGSVWNFIARDGVYFSIADLSNFLSSMPVNTIDTPYDVTLNVSNAGSVGGALKSNSAKYISLHLSGSAFYSWGTDAIIRYNNFKDCTSLVSITLPNSVNIIEPYSFSGCNSLTSITIPDSITDIGYYAFSGCTSLNSITIPNGVTEILNNTFEYCYSLTSVTIPDSVTSIGDDAFHECTSLASVTIPDSVTKIGQQAFAYCSSLTSVTIGNNVTSIEYGVFYGCTSLTGLTIPDSVTSIGDCAFYECASLASVTIPDSVTSIGVDVFGSCLTSVTFQGAISSSGFDNDAFLGLGDLRDKYFAIDPINGTPGTYTRPNTGYGGTWTKQP